jgi:hypothetical protein
MDGEGVLAVDVFGDSPAEVEGDVVQPRGRIHLAVAAVAKLRLRGPALLHYSQVDLLGIKSNFAIL